MIRFSSWSSRDPRNRDWAFSWRGRIEITTSSAACRYVKGRERERDSHMCTFVWHRREGEEERDSHNYVYVCVEQEGGGGGAEKLYSR
jgi:hypothetical protein